MRVVGAVRQGKSAEHIKQILGIAGFTYTDREVEEMIAWAQHAKKD